ncbi:MAG: ArsR/SmtB family transcription factor [Halobacteriota archaeon]
MSELPPSETDPIDDDVRVLWLDDEDTESLIKSLSSDTARTILTALHDEDATASELSESVDTSVQNVKHHVANLREAGLVRVSGARYSVKGREMNVYAPTAESLVVCIGREDDTDDLLETL